MAPLEVFSTAITMWLIGQERVRESFADECPRYRPPLRWKRKTVRRGREADANAEKSATADVVGRFFLFFVFEPLKPRKLVSFWALNRFISPSKEYFFMQSRERVE